MREGCLLLTSSARAHISFCGGALRSNANAIMQETTGSVDLEGRDRRWASRPCVASDNVFCPCNCHAATRLVSKGQPQRLAGTASQQSLQTSGTLCCLCTPQVLLLLPPLEGETASRVSNGPLTAGFPHLMIWWSDSEIVASATMFKPVVTANPHPNARIAIQERSRVGRCSDRKDGSSMIGSSAEKENARWHMLMNRGKPKPGRG